jgi:2-polyprenyl-3-methyl-5-hydroxy-6-metoxy-1,4-benzoquinol methylase
MFPWRAFSMPCRLAALRRIACPRLCANPIVSALVHCALPLPEDAMRSEPNTTRPKGSPAERHVWENQYASGAWDYLAGADEAGHYLAIAHFCQRHLPRGALLDIGCGTGILLDHLQREAGMQPERYHGIDLAQTAVEQAASSHPRAHFAQCDYAAASLPGRFDAIVFNETLYCFADPLAIIDKCVAQNLAQNGLLIVSMYGEHHEDIWQALLARCALVAEEIVDNPQRGVRWKVRALRPHAA